MVMMNMRVSMGVMMMNVMVNLTSSALTRWFRLIFTAFLKSSSRVELVITIWCRPTLGSLCDKLASTTLTLTAVMWIISWVIWLYMQLSWVWVFLDLKLIVDSISIRMILILKYFLILPNNIIKLAIEAIIHSVLLFRPEKLFLLRCRNVQILDRNKMMGHVHVVVLDIWFFIRKINTPRNSRCFHITILLFQRCSKSSLALGLVILIIKIHFVERTLLGVALSHTILRNIIRQEPNKLWLLLLLLRHRAMIGNLRITCPSVLALIEIT